MCALYPKRREYVRALSLLSFFFVMCKVSWTKVVCRTYLVLFYGEFAEVVKEKNSS